ncbi:unnamed protein product, partial [Medioppia subpectinata]
MEPTSTATVERVLSPISLRLKQEMENMDKSQSTSHLRDDSRWTPNVGNSLYDQQKRQNDWAEEEEMYKRKYRQLRNPSPTPEDSLDVERVRIQQMAAIHAGILQSPERLPKSSRRLSPESSPKRMRRRSPSLSPRRRSPLSPRRRSISPRRRSISPRYRDRRRSRSRSRERYLRSRSPSDSRGRRRSRTPERCLSPRPVDRHVNPMPGYQTLMNPMAVMHPMGAQAWSAPPIHQMTPWPQNEIIYEPIIPSKGSQTNLMKSSKPVPRKSLSSNLLKVPIARSPAQSSPKKGIDKKDDKLINPYDLLLAERTKLREEMNRYNKYYEQKVEDQNLIVAKDGGTDSYAYRQLDK